MPTKGLRGVGKISRSPHTQKPRAASARKLSRLRGEEGGATVKGSAFEAAVNMAQPKPKGKKDAVK